MENYKAELTSLKEELTSRIDAVIAKIEKTKRVSGWYKYDECPKWLMYYDFENQKRYGFDSTGSWYTDSKLITSSIKVEATPKEVQEALTKEAVKRGFKIGTKYYSAKYDDGTIGNSSGLNWIFCEETNALYMNGLNGIVFYNGKWAEIIKTKTIDDLADAFYNNWQNKSFNVKEAFRFTLINEKQTIIETLNNL